MSHNTWIHRSVRAAVRPLVDTPVTPNHLTTLRLAIGIVAALALAHGDDLWRHLGAGLFLVAMVLDRADGELARQSGKSSPWGHTYDLVSDTLCNALAFFGLGVGLRAGDYGVWASAMGLVAGLAIAAILWMVMTMEKHHGERAGELAGTAGFDPDDAMLVLPLLVWLGLSDWLLIAAALGAPAFALFMFVLFRRRLAG